MTIVPPRGLLDVVERLHARSKDFLECGAIMIDADPGRRVGQDRPNDCAIDVGVTVVGF